MTLEKKHSVMGLFKKNHNSADPVVITPTSNGTHSPEVVLQPDSSTEFTERDVNFSSLFMPFVKNYVSNLSANKVLYPPL
jgi:hypothetical protein